MYYLIVIGFVGQEDDVWVKTGVIHKVPLAYPLKDSRLTIRLNNQCDASG